MISGLSALISAGVITVEASSTTRQAVTTFYHNNQNANSHWPTSVLRAATRVVLIRAPGSRLPYSCRTSAKITVLVPSNAGKVDIIHVVPRTHESIVQIIVVSVYPGGAYLGHGAIFPDNTLTSIGRPFTFLCCKRGVFTTLLVPRKGKGRPKGKGKGNCIAVTEHHVTHS